MARRLSETQNKAFQQLKKLIQEALDSYQLASFEGEVTIWGIPLLGEYGNERSNLVILKFLRTRNFEALEAFSMIKNTLLWRKEVGIESLLDEDLGDDYEKVMFTNGHDKGGFPVWYLVLEECLNNPSTSYDVDQQRKLLRWLIQFVEKNIRKLNLTNMNSILLVIDLKNFPYYRYRDLYKVIYKFLQLLYDNYPEFVAKQLWINASWWYRTYSRVYSAVFDEWGTNKVVFSGTSKTIDTLFKQISPDRVPVKYGGLSKNDNQEVCSQFSSNDSVSEVIIKPASKHTAEFNFAEECDITWDLRVVGWDVCYEAEFVPSTKGRYITNISKLKKIAPNDEPVISDNFRVTESGKLILTIHNTSSEKKKLLVRIRVMAFNLNMEDGPSLRGWLLLSDES